MTPPLLEVTDLSVEFPQRRQRLQALDRISFTLEAGEILGFVGESGAGKSLTGCGDHGPSGVAGPDHRWPDHASRSAH